MALPSAAARSCWTRRSRPSASTTSPSPCIRKSRSASPSPSREAPMRPSASIAAKTSLPVRKIRMPLPKRSPLRANSSIPRPAATIWSRRRSRHQTSNAGYQLHIIGLLKPGLVRPGFVILAGAFRPILHKNYWEMGGAGGPAGAIGGGGGTEAVTAGAAGCTAGAGGSDADSGMPLETAADTAGAAGAGVTGGTGSGRSTGLSPLPVSFGASILASEVPSPDGLAPWVLSPSTLAVSLVASPFPASPFGASSLPASGFAASVLAASVLAASDLGGSSLPGPPRLLSFALAASGASPGRASRLAL